MIKTDARAAIERGIIMRTNNQEYVVESFTRDGIITPPIPAAIAGLSVGDCVYFFLFDDGQGLIIGRY